MGRTYVIDKQRAGRLFDVDLDEVSLVDRAANNVEGWILMKQKSPALEELKASLKAAEGELEKAPDNVKLAAQELFAFVNATEAAEEESSGELEDAVAKAGIDPLSAAFRVAAVGGRVRLT